MKKFLRESQLLKVFSTSGYQTSESKTFPQPEKEKKT